ncbi:MAG TPA: hypothetical protein VGL58_13795 [Caulobacteraceae bacterium]|jgi:hypothetical protein
MAKPRARRLKVFQAQFGFYDTVVAVPSQAAALRAWGVRQDLFASGEAKVATDGAAVKAALAHPGETLRRAVGSKDPFALQPGSLPKVPDALKKKATATSPAAPKPAAERKPPADRSKLDAAEAALRKVDERRKTEEADLRREEDALEARKSTAQAAYVEARKAATAKVVQARTQYRKAGGRD